MTTTRTSLLFACFILWVAGALVFVPCPAAAQDSVPLSELVRPDWAGPIWDDGNAEVAVYRGERPVYGEARPHQLHLITVKEDLNRELWVKADWPYGQKPLMTVLKQNQVATIRTPNYPYHYMTSVFFERADPSNAVKMVVSSQEWCGTTFKEFQLYQDPPFMARSSYWDGQGSNAHYLSDHGAETYFEEELPLLVRTLRFGEGASAAFELEPNQTTNKAPIPEPSAAALTVRAAGEDSNVPEVEGLTFSAVWNVVVETRDGRRMAFLVGQMEPGDVLLRFDHSDGRVYELESIARRQYW